MEKENETLNQKYIRKSKEKIDKYIFDLNYKSAFQNFILVLQKINETEKKQFIEYYEHKLGMSKS